MIPRTLLHVCTSLSTVVVKGLACICGSSLTDGPKHVTIEGPDALEIGVTASFTCKAECSPPCTFKWTLYGKTMTGSVIDVTVNRHVSKESISCQAENPYDGKTAAVNETLVVSGRLSLEVLECI